MNKILNWHKWNKDTLEKAQEQNKAIFIFIGYESCSLCKEMEKNVLHNEKVIELLERDFIAIKIDKDERADLDKYYQKAHTIINNRVGGWPLSLFATPQNKVFFAGTYIEAFSQEGSIEGMGFIELAQLIGTKVSQDDKDIQINAQEIDDFLNKKEHPTQATKLDKSFTKNFILQVKNNYEVKYGGFSKAPKFPHSATLNTLMKIDKEYEDKAVKAMIVNTLTNMTNGGYFDKTNGGFFRYAKSDDFQTHSNDKTLYDNALLCEVYLNAYKIYDDKSFLNIATKTAGFVSDFMCEEELFSLNIIEEKKDKKVLCVYNAMMIKSLFLLSTIDEKYKTQAIKSLDTLMDTLYIDEILYRQYKGNKAFLEDYAYLASAHLVAYKMTQNEHYLINTQRFINKALEKFYDRGSWNFNEGEFQILAENNDNIFKSAISEIISTMIELGEILQDEKYTHFAFKTLEYNSYDLGRKPSLMPSLLGVMLDYLSIKNV